MATTALAGRARARVWLLGRCARLPHQKPLNARVRRNDPPSPQHLMHALERFPDDPQFQLSRMVAWTWGRDSEPIRNVRVGVRSSGVRALRAPAQLEAITALEPLTAMPESRPRRGSAPVSCTSP